MSEIVPAILPTSRDNLDEATARYAGLAESVQIDVVDGRFAHPAAWPYAEPSDMRALEELANRGGTLPHLGKLVFDIDLMVESPEEVIGTWIVLGASRITVHAESTKSLGALIADFGARYGHDRSFSTGVLSLGIAIDLATDVRIIEPYVSRIDYVQFMGIRTIGKQGELFDPRVIERVRAFHKHYPDVLVQVDGGVSQDTAPALLEAGASRLIIGSVLCNARDVKKTYAELVELTEEYGLYT